MQLRVCVSLGRSGRSTDRLLSSYIPLCTSKYMVDFYLKFVNFSFIFIKVISFFKNVFKYFTRIVILISYDVSKSFATIENAGLEVTHTFVFYFVCLPFLVCFSRFYLHPTLNIYNYYTMGCICSCRL